jgi:phosphohistidine phosphatase
LRHAKSAWDTEASSDHDRPLNKRGRRDAPRVAAKLAELGWIPERVYASDAVRTRETWDRMKDALSPKGSSPKVKMTNKLYMEGIDAIRKQVAKVDDKTKVVMVIGHNPGWEEAVEKLTGKKIRVTTCNAILLTKKADSWKDAIGASDWKVEQVLRPKEL